MSASVHAGMPYPPPQIRQTPPDQADTPPGTRQTPPGPGRPPQGPGRPPQDQADTPLGPGRPPPPREADSSIWSTSGRYASYWNAFLFGTCFYGPCSTSKISKLLQSTAFYNDFKVFLGILSKNLNLQICFVNFEHWKRT